MPRASKCTDVATTAERDRPSASTAHLHTRTSDTSAVAVDALAADLRHGTTAEVRFGSGDRALYATDASNYRQVPIGVVIPRTIDDIVAAMQICRRHNAPILARGGGTSIAGQCCNVAVIIDTSKHLNRVLAIDPAT